MKPTPEEFLISKGWVKDDHSAFKVVADLLREYGELIIPKSSKKTPRQMMGEDYKEKILVYREMFPNKKLPSGKAARCSPGNLEKAFIWFFQNYKYTWDTIFKATAFYLNDQQKKGDKYMRTSQYFIRKDDHSDLADMCDAVESGGYQEEKPAFSAKVV